MKDTFKEKTSDTIQLFMKSILKHMHKTKAEWIWNIAH